MKRIGTILVLLTLFWTGSQAAGKASQTEQANMTERVVYYPSVDQFGAAVCGKTRPACRRLHSQRCQADITAVIQLMNERMRDLEHTATYCKVYGTHTDDSRESHGRKRYHGQSSGQSD